MYKLLLATFTSLLLLGGCVTQTEAWQTLDAGGFTVKTPDGWTYVPKMGIDSTVGEIQSEDMTLVFGYGINTGDYEGNSVYFEDPEAYKVTEETIDGLDAKIYVPKDMNSGKSVVLSLLNIKHSGPCTENVCEYNQENFQMLGDNLNEQQATLAVEIFRTVDFKD